MAALVEAQNITRRLEGDVTVTLVEDVTLSVDRGEFVAITGPSGSGKSSLLYLLGLLDIPTGGRILVEGVETSTLDEDELADIRLSELGFVFQSHFLLPEFTALENVMLPMRRLGKLSLSAMKQRGAELLSNLGLSDQINKIPRQLSGGQSQRVAIARALANDPSLILADEPTGNLDTVSSENVQSILRELGHSSNKSVIVVTHDMDFASTADRRIVIIDGRVKEHVA